MNIRWAVRQSDEDPDFLTNEGWELQKNDSGFVDVYSTAWNQVIAEVTPWGFVNLYIPKGEFLGRVFMRYLGFDHDSLTRAYDEINYQ